MRKIYAILLMLMLSVSLFACGASPNDKNTTAIPTTEEVTTEVLTTEEVTESPTTEEVTTKATTERAKTYSDKEFIDIIAKIVDENMGVGDTIKAVKYENKALTISLQLSDPQEGFTLADVASSRVSSITDVILEQEELDQYWDTITMDFGDVGSKTLTPNDIKGSGSDRYFNVEYTDFQ